MRNKDKTKEVIKAMLTENTGWVLVDSGDAYGRNYQQNMGRDFDNERNHSVSFDGGYIDYTINLYHYLVENLAWVSGLNKRWDTYCDKYEDQEWGDLISLFIKHIGGKDLGAGNTYNDESFLSQGFFYHTFEYKDEYYHFVRIHGGCDARWGYTRPVIFKDISDYGEYGVVATMQDGYIFCDNQECRASWYKDGHTWVSGEQDQETDLDDYPIFDLSEELNGKSWYYGNIIGRGEIIDWDFMEYVYGDERSIIVLSDGSGICPCCGKGKLGA